MENDWKGQRQLKKRIEEAVALCLISSLQPVMEDPAGIASKIIETHTPP